MFYASAYTVANAKGEELPLDNEIVVAIDCSKSMEDADSRYASFDFMKSLSAILPRNYRVGVIAYKDEVCVNLPLGSSYSMIESALNETEYTSYGNAVAGLAAAVALFGDEETAKRIILISSGMNRMQQRT